MIDNLKIILIYLLTSVNRHLIVSGAMLEYINTPKKPAEAGFYNSLIII